MGVIKIRPTVLLNTRKVMKKSIEEIQDSLNEFDRQYNSLYNTVLQRVNLSTSTSIIREKMEPLIFYIDYLDTIVKELLAATNLNEADLLSGNYDEDYIEDKLLEYYAKYSCMLEKSLITSDEAFSHFYLLDDFYDFYIDGQGQNPKLKKYIKKARMILEIEELCDTFDFEKFGLKLEKVKEEIEYIIKTQGINQAKNVVLALLNNCPANYFDYFFKPGKQILSNVHYNYDGSVIGNYSTNSEIITINGVKVDIAQVIPKDCTSIEKLVYDFCKANVINTLRTLPNEYTNVLKNKNNVIVLACDCSVMDDKGPWGGYYAIGNFLCPEQGDIIINAKGSFSFNKYYTVDIVIHELGHKYDDILNSGILADTNLGNYYHSVDSQEWKDMYEKYKSILPDIVPYGYSEEGLENASTPLTEFFAESMSAYFLEPDALESFCPEIKSMIDELLGDDYGGCYVNNIEEVLNTPFDIESYGNGYPEPVPGLRPEPLETPAPRS